MIRSFLALFIITTSLLTGIYPVDAHARADTVTAYSVSGWVNSNGQAYLDPIWSQPDKLDVSSNPPDGSAYCLDGKDLQSNLLGSRCFDITFPPHDPNGDPLVQRFSLVINLPAPVVSISLREGTDVLAERRASSNKPTISFAVSDPVLPAGGTAELTWQAADADDDPLLYRVSYSTGGGWLLLDSNISEPSLPIDLDGLPGSDAVQILVEATDGFLNARVISAPFRVNNKPPQIRITAPKDGDILPEDEIIRLNAQVEDLEEGELAKGQIRWSSNVQGELGEGAALDVKLSKGAHILTITANDRSGQSATSQVKVTVGVPRPPLAGEGGLLSTRSFLIGGAVLMALVLVLGGVSLYYERGKPEPESEPAPRKKAPQAVHHGAATHKPARPAEATPASAAVKVNTGPLPHAPAFLVPEAKPVVVEVKPPARPINEGTYLQALADIKAGRYEQAVRPLALFMQTHPDRRDGWMWLGFAAQKLGHSESAFSYYQRALVLGHPGAAKAMRDLGSGKL